jgi:RNA 2',3'-cyclic 3'-phosphodiesterase
MQRVRAFIAIPVASGVAARASELIKRLRTANAAVNWVAPQNLHLTLKFLGETPINESPEICEAVRRAVAEAPPFDVSFRGLGAFPSIEKPRTIWLGVSEGEAELAELAARIDDELFKLGYAREARKFSGHLTIGRVRETVPSDHPLLDAMAKHADFDANIMGVDEVAIYASFLDRKGPTYDALGTVELLGY